MRVEPYLSFSGTCEQALTFYRDLFGGEICGLMRYSEAPGDHHLPADHQDAVMHATMKAPTVTIMGSDTFREALPPGGSTRVRLSIGSSDPVEGERLFTALADGGEIHQPYQKQFWGAHFGMCTDRFGIDWMVNAG